VERVVAFYSKRGTCEQWIKEGKNAIKWRRLSCCSFAANAVRHQLHALAYNLANFMRTLALPEAGECVITTGRVRLNDEGKGRIDGSGVVLAGGHGGTAGETAQVDHGFLGTRHDNSLRPILGMHVGNIDLN